MCIRDRVRRISRNDVNLIGIVFDAIKNGFGKRAVIAAELVVPSAWVVL